MNEEVNLIKDLQGVGVLVTNLHRAKLSNSKFFLMIELCPRTHLTNIKIPRLFNPYIKLLNNE